MNAMEKEMPRELERALREIEQLRQENARLRKKLGIEVSEPKAITVNPGLLPRASILELKNFRKPVTTEDATRFPPKHRESAPIFPLKKR